MVAREGFKPSSLCFAYRDSFFELSDNSWPRHAEHSKCGMARASLFKLRRACSFFSWLRHAKLSESDSEAWYLGGGSNPYALRHWILNPACLPIPPPRPVKGRKAKSGYFECKLFSGLFSFPGEEELLGEAGVLSEMFAPEM